MNAILRNIGGFYVVVLTQMFAWLVTITILTAVTTLAASAFTETTSVSNSLLVGSWVAILVGGPVAIAATAVCLRRYLRKDGWPTFHKTGRKVVTGVWLAMALILATSTDSVVNGIPWYGAIAAGIWGVAPLIFRLAPVGPSE